MNELQLGLIALGAAAVAGVFAYNKWQERRHRRLAEQVLQRGHEDVLLGGAGDERREPPAAVSPSLPERDADGVPDVRIEPVLRVDDEDCAPAPNPLPPEPELPAADETVVATVVAEDIEASEGIVPAEPSAVAAAARTAPPETSADAIVSPAIDYIASFELVEAVSGDQILRSQRDFLSRLTKPVGWAGCNERNGQWERVNEEGSYRSLQIGLLLADRRGPLGEADLLTFHGAMLNLADELMAVAEMPPRESALDAAIALDQFCANVDIQVGINVVSKGQPFLGTKIRALAEAAGMVLDASGRFVRCDDEGHVLYTMANQESAGFSAEAMKTMSTHGLVFVLDVPCVSHGDRVFAQMLDLARRMADALGGALVDDNRRPLTEAMLDPFRRQIGQYQSQLAAKGLPAGGPLALRLFS